VAQPLDLLQGRGFRNLQLDVPDLLRGKACRVGHRLGGSGGWRKRLARNESFGALLDLLKLLLALLGLEQGLGFGAFLPEVNKTF